MRAVALLAALVGLGGLAPAAIAQGFPSKPVRLVVPFAPGGTNDIAARGIAPELGEVLGQVVVVENRAGAGGQIGAEAVAKSPPDGHTLMMASSSVMTNAPAVYSKLRYDILKDFAPVGRVGELPLVIVVHPTVPAKTPQQFIALAKARPKDIRMATGGPGTTSHLIAELFALSAGVQVLIVPYKGAGPALIDLLGGHVDARVDQISSSLEHIKSNRLRAVAVTTTRRSAQLPNLPTLSESGLKGFDASTVNAILAPAATPQEIVRRLNAALVKTLGMPAVIERFNALGVELRPSTSDELATFIREDLAKWRRVVRETGLKLE
ncbi:MAG TPA: tripartite tricarboxylate transporter substrate binding protein [Burkholderiales bacterium]